MRLINFLNRGETAAATQLRDAYRLVFGSELAERVLQDLADVCCVTQPLVPDEIDRDAILVNAGRQEVYRHIMNMVRLPNEALKAPYDKTYDREQSDFYGTE